MWKINNLSSIKIQNKKVITNKKVSLIKKQITLKGTFMTTPKSNENIIKSNSIAQYFIF